MKKSFDKIIKKFSLEELKLVKNWIIAQSLKSLKDDMEKIEFALKTIIGLSIVGILVSLVGVFR